MLTCLSGYAHIDIIGKILTHKHKKHCLFLRRTYKKQYYAKIKIFSHFLNFIFFQTEKTTKKQN